MPEEFLEVRNRGLSMTHEIRRPEFISQPEADGENTRIHQLMELHAHLTVAAKHGDVFGLRLLTAGHFRLP
jgi:hypothetical protein